MTENEQAPETLELSDATLTLWRGCKFMYGTQQTASGDHMLVKHKMPGYEEDVVVIQEGGKQRVKRVVHHIEFPSGRGSYSFADLSEESEKRLLAIYKMFKKKPM